MRAISYRRISILLAAFCGCILCASCSTDDFKGIAGDSWGVSTGISFKDTGKASLFFDLGKILTSGAEVDRERAMHQPKMLPPPFEPTAKQ